MCVECWLQGICTSTIFGESEFQWNAQWVLTTKSGKNCYRVTLPHLELSQSSGQSSGRSLDFGTKKLKKKNFFSILESGWHNLPPPPPPPPPMPMPLSSIGGSFNFLRVEIFCYFWSQEVKSKFDFIESRLHRKSYLHICFIPNRIWQSLSSYVLSYLTG